MLISHSSTGHPTPGSTRSGLWIGLLVGGIVLLAAALVYAPVVISTKLDPVFIYYTLLAFSLALILGSLVEYRLRDILTKIGESKECCKKSESARTEQPIPPASPETERMKIQIAADYTNTVYTNMIFFLFASLVAVVVALAAPLLAKPSLDTYVYYFLIPTLVVEGTVIVIVLYEYGIYRRRLRFIDSLIDMTEKTPPQPLGRLDDLLHQLRRA